MNLLYTSYYYSSYQCDNKRCFFVDFGEKPVKMSFCQLLALRQKVNAIDLNSHFDSSMNFHGIEILTLCNRDHIIILDTLQVIDLKQLIKATFGMLELNALVAQTV